MAASLFINTWIMRHHEKRQTKRRPILQSYSEPRYEMHQNCFLCCQRETKVQEIALVAKGKGGRRLEKQRMENRLKSFAGSAAELVRTTAANQMFDRSRRSEGLNFPSVLRCDPVNSDVRLFALMRTRERRCDV